MWKTVKLGDVCTVTNGSTPLRKEKRYWEEGNIPWFTIDDFRVQGKNIRYTKQNVTQAAVDDKKVRLVPANSVLLCCTASIGVTAIARVPMATNQQFNALTPKSSSLNSDYLYFVATTLTKNLLSVSGSTTINFVSMSKLKNISIPLPPLEEQKRIVAKLDAAFAEIDEAIELTALKKEEINKFKCSILNINNKKNDFYNSALNNWEELKIGDICDLMTGGTPSRKVPEYFDKGEIKWLVSGDINQKEIFDCDGRITEEGFNNSSVKFLPKNSVLIALNGQGKTRGTVAILRTKATCNQSLVSIFPKPGVNLNTKYLYYFLEGMYDKIRRITGDSGNDRRGLNMPLIRNIKILLPTIKEQENIISKLEIVINELDIANGVLKESTKNYEALKSAILLKELQPSEAA